MDPYFCGHYGNAGSTHKFGDQAREAVDKARAQVARVLGCQPEEIIFTSGATESNNLAIKGAAEAARRDDGRNKVITVSTEHKAVLGPVQALKDLGFDRIVMDVGPDGIVDLEELGDLVGDDTALVSVMGANNETGVIQDLETIGQICARTGARFHTDAAQAFGKIDLPVDRFNVDLLSISAHKVYGPKGVGALYVRGGTDSDIVCQQLGGGQEGDLRSGTLNVPGIVGLGAAAELASEDDVNQHRQMAERMLRRLRQGLGEVIETCSGSPKLDGLLHCCIPGVDTFELIERLGPYIAFSRGSACLQGKKSYVLEAMGLGDDYSDSCIRIKFGRGHTMQDVEIAAKHIVGAVEEMRETAENRT